MKIPVLLAVLGLVVFRKLACGMAEERVGPDKSAVAQPGWAKGLVEMVRHPSRVYSIWVNGNENFYFQATPEEINELLDLFGKTRLRDYEVRIEPGTNAATSFGGGKYEYNVSLHVLSGIVLAVTRDKDAAAAYEPVLTIYTGEDDSLVKRLKVPEKAIVQCEIPGIDFKTKATRPVRRAWYGCVQFDDGSPAVDFEHGLSTRITLWEQTFPDGIELGTVSYQGFFGGAFSDRERADLDQGRSWLTVSLGTWASEAKRTDAQFPVALLAAEQVQAKPLKVARPPYYYGRILFEDGSPPVLTPPPWPGAEIRVEFPYSGGAKPGADGYFQLFLEPEQFEKLKARKPSKNIYCPVRESGSSVASETFPAELLSLDKAKAGVIRIPKLAYPPVYDPAKALPLVGRNLPPLGDLGLKPPAEDTAHRMALICFFNVQERPSRNCVAALAKRAEDLKTKGVWIVAVQAGAADRDALANFCRTNAVSFPVGNLPPNPKSSRSTGA